jgi:hypothetical protein
MAEQVEQILFGSATAATESSAAARSVPVS